MNAVELVGMECYLFDFLMRFTLCKKRTPHQWDSNGEDNQTHLFVCLSGNGFSVLHIRGTEARYVDVPGALCGAERAVQMAPSAGSLSPLTKLQL